MNDLAGQSDQLVVDATHSLCSYVQTRNTTLSEKYKLQQ